MRQCALTPTAVKGMQYAPCRAGQVQLRRGLVPVHRRESAPRSVAARVGGQPGLYPFNEERFTRVCLVRKPPYGPLKMLPSDQSANNTCSGVLVFKKEAEMLGVETQVLEVFVSGDTANNIYTLLNNHQYDRPMVHDLMWTFMANMTNRHCQLLKVAIVALKDDVYIGRLFFGDPKTGDVMWDCDCRPSDGCYLHLKSGCPFYISQDVWDSAAVPVRMSKVHLIAVHEAQLQQQQQQESATVHHQVPQPPSPKQDESAVEVATTPSRAPVQVMVSPPPAAGEYTTVKPEDPEPIKLLKRKLALAVAEEDYRAAISIRDHPYMQIYSRIQAFVSFGKLQEAEDLEAELHGMIRREDLML